MNPEPSTKTRCVFFDATLSLSLAHWFCTCWGHSFLQSYLSVADFRLFQNGSHAWRRVFLLTILGGLLSLPACRSLPAPRSLPHRTTESALIPATARIPLSDGDIAPTRLYAPTPSASASGNAVPIRGVILAFHGFGDSRDAWEVIAPPLTQAHYLIVAPDIRGFGEHPTKNNWSNTKRMVADGLDALHWCQTYWPHQPIYLMGESMGGALALLTATTATDTSANMQPAGLILLAPAIMKLPFPLQTILDGWDLLTPNAQLTGANIPGHHVATRNVPALRRFFFDPLTRHGTTVHALRGLTHLMRQAANNVAHLRTPTLLIWGDNDQFVPASATLRFIRHAPPALLRQDELPHAYHLITREPFNRPVKDILSWLNNPASFLPSGGDTAATTWLWLHSTR